MIMAEEILERGSSPNSICEDLRDHPITFVHRTSWGQFSSGTVYIQF